MRYSSETLLLHCQIKILAKTGRGHMTWQGLGATVLLGAVRLLWHPYCVHCTGQSAGSGERTPHFLLLESTHTDKPEPKVIDPKNLMSKTQFLFIFLFFSDKKEKRYLLFLRWTFPIFLRNNSSFMISWRASWEEEFNFILTLSLHFL